MIVAVARLVQVDWEWELAVSLFQPESQGSVPAATLTLARLRSPALCSMPGWVQAEGAASAVVAANAPLPRASAAPSPPAVLRRPRRLNSVVRSGPWGEVRLMLCVSIPWGEAEGDHRGVMLTSSNSEVTRASGLREQATMPT